MSGQHSEPVFSHGYYLFKSFLIIDSKETPGLSELLVHSTEFGVFHHSLDTPVMCASLAKFIKSRALHSRCYK